MSSVLSVSEGHVSGAVHLERGGLHFLLGVLITFRRAVTGRASCGTESQRATGRGEAAGAGLNRPVQVAARGHQVTIALRVREGVAGAAGAGTPHAGAL